MTRMLTHTLGMIVLCSLMLFSSVHAQEVAVPDPAAVERDARRVADLQRIKQGLDVYAARYWFYPRYDILSPAMSDGQWRRTGNSRDFRRRLRDIVNSLPIDPWNDPMQNFRYVYGHISLDSKDAPDCAGKTVLFAARVETDAAEYEQCDLGGTDKRILYVITSEKKAAVPVTLAGAFVPFRDFFYVNFLEPVHNLMPR